MAVAARCPAPCCYRSPAHSSTSTWARRGTAPSRARCPRDPAHRAPKAESHHRQVQRHHSAPARPASRAGEVDAPLQEPLGDGPGRAVPQVGRLAQETVSRRQREALGRARRRREVRARRAAQVTSGPGRVPRRNAAARVLPLAHTRGAAAPHRRPRLRRPRHRCTRLRRPRPLGSPPPLLLAPHALHNATPQPRR